MKMIQSKARAEAFLQGLMAAKANFFFKIKSPSFNYFLFWSPAFNKGPFILSSVTKCFFFVFVLLYYKRLAYFLISNLFGQSKIKPTSCRLRLFLTAFFNLCDESFYKTASASASASASRRRRRRRRQ